jgi:hypothetical protein
MTAGPVGVVQVILIVVFSLVVLGIGVPCVVTFWRSYRQLRRDRRARKLHFGEPR